MTTPDPYARTVFRGRPLDHATAAALRDAEDELGYRLTIVQGIGGATASGGTHTQGRAVDLAAYDHKRKVRVLRDLGFAAWYRPDRPQVWGEHIHAVLIFENRSNRKGLAAEGFAQIGKYDRGEDGLAGSTRDPNPYRPSPRAVFTMHEYDAEAGPQPTNVTRARDALVEALHNLGTAAAFLEETPETREVAQAAATAVRRQRRELRDLLERMPKR